MFLTGRPRHKSVDYLSVDVSRLILLSVPILGRPAIRCCCSPLSAHPSARLEKSVIILGIGEDERLWLLYSPSEVAGPDDHTADHSVDHVAVAEIRLEEMSERCVFDTGGSGTAVSCAQPRGTGLTRPGRRRFKGQVVRSVDVRSGCKRWRQMQKHSHAHTLRTSYTVYIPRGRELGSGPA